jgi:hypothetical protein
MESFYHLPEVFVATRANMLAVSRATRKGTLRRITTRLYTHNLKESIDQIMRRNLWQVIAALLPGAVISDRTALENRPAADGSIFLTAARPTPIELPGATLRPAPGPAALESDPPFIGGLRISSPGRAFLENMRSTRARQSVARTLPKREVEERLETILNQSGEAGLQRLRDQARQVSQHLGWTAEFQKLDGLIGTLLGTRRAKLISPQAVARAAGLPYDARRVELFEGLFRELSSTSAFPRPARATDGRALAFFEAYFSNFIEGTEFAVSEAAQIVFDGQIPASRPSDAHDILGTWKVAADDREMRRTPNSVESLFALLRSRHAAVMGGRPEKMPGEFKTESNRAGNTVFVEPPLVKGTLAKAYEMYRGLYAPFQRAVFLMGVVAEVHPFADGNGRVARLMMNAELVAGGETRIIIPTIFRLNYLMALKAWSQNGIPGAVARALDFAQRFTAFIDFADFERAHEQLKESQAFLDAAEAELAGIRLRVPSMAVPV